ncbi:MAG: hypothetical protein GEU93_10460 [Propionibacteriales bacterium]|nr:hypothetical protein [Propionibacteriales bacterium]
MNEPIMPAADAARRLATAGIPMVRAAWAETVADVRRAFHEIGAPHVVLKAGGLTHKTDEDGVELGIASAAQATDAAASMHERLGDRALPFVLQEQVTGIEMLVGIRRLPRLGAALVVGTGGVLAELHQDVARALAPITTTQALQMLRRLRVWPLLEGYRGSPPADVVALVDVIVHVSALAEDHPEIAELDCNPVMVGHRGTGAAVVDARIVTGAAPSPKRPHRDLNRMLRPRHVVVVGVSDDEHKVGARLFRYLVDHGFTGRLDAVHPAGGTVRGHACHKRLSDVDGSPDLVCVSVPANAVNDVAREAAALGAGGLLVHSSGFAEIGPDGRAAQRELARICAEGGVPLAGPNNMGIVAPGSRLTASISGGLEMSELLSGEIALLTSSGALGSCLATRLIASDVGLSYWIHTGNEADIVMADYLDWLADDPATTAAGLLIENIEDGPRLVSAGQRMHAAGKRVFAYNMVRSEMGRAAAYSHTGAMVDDHDLREDVLRAAGIVSVTSLRVLEDALLLASAGKPPRGTRLAVVTFSGGAATIIADEVQRHGIELPELSEATREEVRRLVPSFAAVRNPLDVSYQMLSDPENMEAVLRALAESDEFDALLVQFTTNADPYAADLAQAVIDVRHQISVPLYVSRYGGAQLAPRALERYRAAGVQLLDAPDRAAEAVAVLMRAGAPMHERELAWTST